MHDLYYLPIRHVLKQGILASMRSRFCHFIAPLVVGTVALHASPLLAQANADSGTFFVSAKLGVNTYSGELDGEGTNSEGARSRLGWLQSEYGPGIGVEGGYSISPQWSVGAGLLVSSYPALDRADITNPQTGQQGQLNDGSIVSQLYGLGRFTPIRLGSFSPYAQAGFALLFGQGRDPANGQLILGYGPVVGLGVELPVSSESRAFVEIAGSMVVPDDALDNSDPSAYAVGWADNADYDATIQFAVGLRYIFGRDRGIPVSVEVSCPDSIAVGQAGQFVARANPEATQPVLFTWSYGDGTGGLGSVDSHTFQTRGNFEVTVEAKGALNHAMASCLVFVSEPSEPIEQPEPIEPLEPPAIDRCDAAPRLANTGQTVLVTADLLELRADSVVVDFGDSSREFQLPAQHSYDESGEYLVLVSGYNSAGSTTCVASVSVADNLCEEFEALNPAYRFNSVFFDNDSAEIGPEAISLLRENLEYWGSCQNVCVAVNGYTGLGEQNPNDLSTRRALAVAEYYGDSARVRFHGRGGYVEAHPGIERPADFDPRVVESIPLSCDMLYLMD